MSLLPTYNHLHRTKGFKHTIAMISNSEREDRNNKRRKV
jgi:hypothetical protein